MRAPPAKMGKYAGSRASDARYRIETARKTGTKPALPSRGMFPECTFRLLTWSYHPYLVQNLMIKGIKPRVHPKAMKV
jgi:hypothetical protein